MKTDSNKVEVGDLVWWAPKYGRPAEPVRIKSIDVCSRPGEKYGIPVDAVFKNGLSSCCVTLDNGHWAYGYAVVPLTVSEADCIDRLNRAA